MRYLVLACDFDGTLAHDGHVEEPVTAALQRLRASGRRLVMVTGRELADLAQVFHNFELFEYVVAENGGTLYHPATDAERPLAPAPSEHLTRALASRGVAPLSVGRAIVATLPLHH